MAEVYEVTRTAFEQLIDTLCVSEETKSEIKSRGVAMVSLWSKFGKISNYVSIYGNEFCGKDDMRTLSGCASCADLLNENNDDMLRRGHSVYCVIYEVWVVDPDDPDNYDPDDSDGCDDDVSDFMKLTDDQCRWLGVFGTIAKRYDMGMLLDLLQASPASGSPWQVDDLSPEFVGACLTLCERG